MSTRRFPELARANARKAALKRYGHRKPPKEEPEDERLRTHNMIRKRKDGIWHVRVKDAQGREHHVTTGERDLQTALRAVDASGVQKLAILARAKVLTADVAQVLVAGQNKTCADIHADWTKNMKMDCGKGTASVYAAYGKKFLGAIGCMNLPMNVITREQIYDFVNNNTLKETSRMIRLMAIQSLFRHEAGFGHIIGNLASTVSVNRSLLTVEQCEQEPAIPFTKEEYDRIMASPTTPKFWRWACSLGYWLGLRRSDVMTLEMASLGEDFAVLYPDKTKRRLVLPLHDPLLGSGQLKQVFAEIRAAAPVGSTYCFLPAIRENTNRFNNEFAMVMKDVGIVGKRFHGFRHTFKVRLEQSGKTLKEISLLMGHTDTKVTEGYGRASA
jgi:integrase